MAVQVSYPGVYIDEFAPGAPIQGVGTSTAAFIGPALRGPMDQPRKLTSWDEFLATFGPSPAPGFWLWYAVRGFFENGGTACYVVRASNGAQATLELTDRTTAANPILRIRAVQPGAPATPIQVQIAGTQVLQTTAFRPTGSYTIVSGRELRLTDAAEAGQFRPGDLVDVGAAGTNLPVGRVSADLIILTATAGGAIGDTGTIRLADLPAGATSLRIATPATLPAGGLVRGTLLTVSGSTTDSQYVETVQTEPLPGSTTIRVGFRRPLGTAISLDPGSAATDVKSEEFDLTITQGTTSTIYRGLSMDAGHPRYVVSALADDALIDGELVEPAPAVAPPDNLPVDLAATALAGGTNENLATLGDQDFIDALDRLREIDDVNLVAIPDGAARAAVQQAVIAHCELLQDRFGILDSAPGLEPFGPNGVETQRNGLDSARGYAALYYPWLRAAPVGGGPPILVPPSGHMCGIMARTDQNRGVHKAPAGLEATVNGAVGVERRLADDDHGLLNRDSSVNVIRVFRSGGRPVVWGARTTATDRNWQYVNIRRLFLFLEESIAEGIAWAVFEPNNLALWQKLRRTITEFLTRVWRDGALFGAAPEDAFYVRIDEVLNPFSEQALGRLNLEIGIRPTYPAEFIVVRIGIWPGGSEVTEA
jgi:uncharacterized protein